jgi:hypothetical protein
MEQTCDVCGATEGIRCEIMMKGEQLDRVYHLCHEHWVVVYSRCLEDFLEENEYKVNSYIKSVCDKLIVDAIAADKMESIEEDGTIDLTKFNPVDVRTLRPYEGEEYEGGLDE